MYVAQGGFTELLEIARYHPTTAGRDGLVIELNQPGVPLDSMPGCKKCLFEHYVVSLRKALLTIFRIRYSTRCGVNCMCEGNLGVSYSGGVMLMLNRLPSLPGNGR